MKFITKAVLKAAPPLGATNGKDPKDVRVVAKWFNPQGRGTFYMTELDPAEMLAYGYVRGELGPDCDEMGYFCLNELRSIRLRFGLGIERDMHFGRHTLAEAMERSHL